jgi:hypothetical protein
LLRLLLIFLFLFFEKQNQFGAISIYCALIGIFIVLDITPTKPGAPILYEFFSGTLFIPVVGRLFQVLACKLDHHNQLLLMGARLKTEEVGSWNE